MKKRFTESQIVAAIKKQEAGMAVKEFVVRLASVMLPFITGRPNMVEWRPVMSNGLKNLKLKTLNSRACMLKPV